MAGQPPDPVPCPGWLPDLPDSSGLPSWLDDLDLPDLPVAAPETASEPVAPPVVGQASSLAPDLGKRGRSLGGSRA